jgi:hypothetical protein
LRPAVKNAVFGRSPGVVGAKRSPQSPSISNVEGASVTAHGESSLPRVI